MLVFLQTPLTLTVHRPYIVSVPGTSNFGLGSACLNLASKDKARSDPLHPGSAFGIGFLV